MNDMEMNGTRYYDANMVDSMVDKLKLDIAMKAKPNPSFAPMYCALYPDLACLARQHGYALAAHGSLQRDFDLICIPWADNPSKPSEVVRDMVSEFAFTEARDNPVTKAHGRMIFTLSIGFGECFVDLSFMPRLCASESNV